MKVHIIDLDPEDDHVSVRDKISWARESKVVLVWPRHGRPLSRRLDLTIVQRDASRRKLELGLVTFEPEVIAHANQLNIPVFESLEKLPPGTWAEPSRPRVTRREHQSLADLRETRDMKAEPLMQLGERGRRITIGISILAVLALAVSILPSAEIVMDPMSIPIEQNISIWIDPSPGASSGMIPGQLLSAEISGDMRIETTGRVRLPQSTASGEVKFTNLTDEEFFIPAGTGLRAGEIRFLTSEGAILEAGEDSSVVLAIEAAEPGISGNVAAQAIDSVEGPLGFLVAVSNHEPTRGGGDHVTGAVSAGDMDDLRRALEAELIDRAQIALVQQLDRGHELIPASLRVADVIEERFDVGLGEAADSLRLILVLQVEGLGYSVPLIREVAEQELLAGLPNHRLLIPGSLSLEAIDSIPKWPAMEVTFAVEGALAKSADSDLLRKTIVGDPKAQAAARLEQLLGLEVPPLIQTSPGWMPWVPLLGMRIDFKWVWENA